MPAHPQMLEIVHSGATQTAVGEYEAAWLDDFHRHVETGAEPHHGSGVLRDVGLEKDEAQDDLRFPRRTPGCRAWRRALCKAGKLLYIPRAGRRAAEPQGGGSGPGAAGCRIAW